MSRALTQKLLSGVAFLFVFSTSSTLAGQYPDEATSTRTTVTVQVVWLDTTAAVNTYCSFLMNQPIPTDGVIVGCYDPSTMTIYAVEPKNFNDRYRLEILGHEFWHALGATHPEM